MRTREARLHRTLTAALAVLVVSTGAAACGDEPSDLGASSSTEATGGSTTVAPGGVNALDHPERVPDLVRAHLGENPDLRRITLDDSGFTVQVRDAVKRDNMDDYDFHRGVWTSRPVSVSLSEIADYEKVTFHLSDVNWEAVPGLIRQALDGLDLEGESVGAVGFDKLAGDPPRVYIGVNGLRGSGRLIANADGTNVDVQRS
ncbi:MAG: hypothetical protein U0Q22_09970 [Acidimicrobiales bacterium]